MTLEEKGRVRVQIFLGPNDSSWESVDCGDRGKEESRADHGVSSFCDQKHRITVAKRPRVPREWCRHSWGHKR